MDSGKVNDWLQIVGMFGVIASLIFVGLQMKQNQEIALSSAYQARTQMAVDVQIASSANTAFTSATAKFYRGAFDEITPEEMVALEYDFGANMTLFENLHFQYEAGFLPKEHWSKTMADMHCYLSSLLYRELLEGWEFRRNFQTIVEEIKSRATKNPSSCWTQVGSLSSDNN
jgi:hypothetical protein